MVLKTTWTMGQASAFPIVPNNRLAMLLFLAAEAMFFAGLIGAYLVFRMGSVEWPPFGQTRLPLVVTGINTVLLVLSSQTMRQGFHSVRNGMIRQTVRWLGATLVLGSCFLGIQGFEWVRLMNFGLTLSSGPYGFTFYTIVGCHAAHVTAAVLWLSIVFDRTMQGRFSADRHVGLDLCRMYWYFVTGLWPVLYSLVYV